MDTSAHQDGDVQPEISGSCGELSEGVEVTIVEMLARAEGTSPQDLSFCLHDYIDADALGQLLTTADSELEVTFTVEDYRILVDEDGRVSCRET